MKQFCKAKVRDWPYITSFMLLQEGVFRIFLMRIPDGKQKRCTFSFGGNLI